MVMLTSISPTFIGAASAPQETSLVSQVSDLKELKQSIFLTLENTPELAPLKESLTTFLNELFANGYVKMSEEDAKARPLFVTSQGLIEQNLALLLQSQKVTKLVGMIHTPTPATPLCMLGDITERLVDPLMQNDEKRLYTVRARANIVRDYIELGGQLFVVYPKGGLEKRSQEQQDIYLKTLAGYQDKNLFDCQLSTSQMDADMVGATYLFEDIKHNQYLFGLKATQANAVDDQKTWEMWLGPVQNKEVEARLDRVQSFLNHHGGPALKL